MGLAFAGFPGQPLVGLPVALAFIMQMLVAGRFYRYLLRQGSPDSPSAAATRPQKPAVFKG